MDQAEKLRIGQHLGAVLLEAELAFEQRRRESIVQAMVCCLLVLRVALALVADDCQLRLVAEDKDLSNVAQRYPVQLLADRHSVLDDGLAMVLHRHRLDVSVRQ